MFMVEVEEWLGIYKSTIPKVMFLWWINHLENTKSIPSSLTTKQTKLLPNSLLPNVGKCVLILILPRSFFDVHNHLPDSISQSRVENAKFLYTWRSKSYDWVLSFLWFSCTFNWMKNYRIQVETNDGCVTIWYEKSRAKSADKLILNRVYNQLCGLNICEISVTPSV